MRSSKRVIPPAPRPYLIPSPYENVMEGSAPSLSTQYRQVFTCSFGVAGEHAIGIAPAR